MKKQQDSSSRRNFLKHGVLAATAGATAMVLDAKTARAAVKKPVSDKKMPTGKIGNLEIGRVVCGSNLISMNMHARDLVYVNGLAAHYNTEERDIVKAYEIMRKYNIPVGIGAHRLEPVMFCEKEKLKPDFYFLTFHHDKYWSAHPGKNRRFIEMFDRNSSDHNMYHDNMFCHEPERTREFMQDVKAPWMAFKVMAAGAISPTGGFKYALQGGADFMCVGMFDYQVAEDAQIVRGLLARDLKRKRPWH